MLITFGLIGGNWKGIENTENNTQITPISSLCYPQQKVLEYIDKQTTFYTYPHINNPYYYYYFNI